MLSFDKKGIILGITAAACFSFSSAYAELCPAPSSNARPNNQAECTSNKTCLCSDGSQRSLSCEYVGQGYTSRVFWKIDRPCPM